MKQAWLVGSIAVFSLCVGTIRATAADTAADPDGRTWAASLVFENDIFASRDQHYTNGIRLAWLSAADRVPGFLRRAVGVLPMFRHEGHARVEYAAGQSMYTPADVRRPDPDPDDRPYAGWLYGSVGLALEHGRTLDRLELAVGIVGPAALAEETQRFVHELIGDDPAEGWSAQLRNEPGIVLTYERAWRGILSVPLGPFALDLSPHLGAAVGNVFTYANAGATLRLGPDLPLDYGPPRIEPSLPGSGFFGPRNGFGWYLFAEVDGRAVARNIFLDGNTWKDSRSVDKEPFVADLRAGLALTFGRVQIAYTQVVRTREFKTQGEHDEFGTVSVSFRY
ncbi:MAG TPA: lipid A deacylase LpxR family protein [Thermodesulfobacteriota bacterium]